jgi:hypothetical protein
MTELQKEYLPSHEKAYKLYFKYQAKVVELRHKLSAIRKGEVCVDTPQIREEVEHGIGYYTKFMKDISDTFNLKFNQ